MKARARRARRCTEMRCRDCMLGRHEYCTGIGCICWGGNCDPDANNIEGELPW